ncbi:unnamed protein product [Cyclocybe aegerita]|uniref:Uncharacterized protein n=1 Tax=Cyclocybe aegerita TaxID=1973307 RepID=A0A8S0VZJ8_CYCAE|nr:unnamed protein product [Cyclocybe aegerita]
MFLLFTLVYIMRSIKAETTSAPTSTPLPHLDRLIYVRQDSGPAPVSSCTCPDTRTIWNVIWSCFSTIFICTWLSVHPNVPGPQESPWAIRGRRLKLMIWAFIGPELFIIWAYRQRFMAKKIAEKYRSRGWTIAHGFFLVMGGFHLYDCEKDLGVLSVQRFNSLIESNTIDFPSALTREDIEDKSKADGLSKGITIIQTSWFVLQCIARGVQKLPLTELEVVTLALASLNALIYGLWWNKPLDVQRCLKITLKASSTAIEQPIKSNPDQVIEDGDRNLIYAPISADLKKNTPASPSAQDQDARTGHENVARSRISRMHNSLTLWVKVTRQEFYDYRMNERRRRELRAERLTFTRFILHRVIAELFIIPISELTEGEFQIPEGFDRVTNYYHGVETLEDLHAIRPSILLWVGIAISAVFGAIHCIAWGFSFPSKIQRDLWRAMSLAVIASPLVFFCVPSLYSALLKPSVAEFVERWRSRRGVAAFFYRCVGNLPGVLEVLVRYISASIYIAARVGLLGIALASLGDLPPDTLRDVDWVDFLPHL